MPPTSLLIQNGQLVTEKGLECVNILIEAGLVTSIKPANEQTSKPRSAETIDAANLLIFPGLIDCHVHFREPGNTEAEDMASGALAARSGGVTTVCEMPNTSPPTCTIDALQDKRERSKRVKDCDIRFFFGVTKREHLEEVKKVKREDICGVKLYLGHSTGNQKVEGGVEEEVFKICAERGLPLVCHCEDEEIIQKNLEMNRRGGSRTAPTDVSIHSVIRSVEAAVASTTYAIGLAKKYGTHLHIAHLSTKEELDLVRRAKSDGLSVTCEVAPHHLFLSVEDYKTLGTLAKMNPPLRDRAHGGALWGGILDGTVDCIGSDHAPHTLSAKNVKNPLEAPSGVPGVETILPLLLSCLSGGPKDASSKDRLVGVHASTGLSMTPVPLQPHQIFRLLFQAPNEIFSLGKPGIKAGKPVDLTLVNPLAKWKIEGKKLHSKCGWTSYEGWEVTGKIEKVIRSS